MSEVAKEICKNTYVMDLDVIKSHKIWKYAKDVVDGNIVAGRYIKSACEKFVNDVENNDNCKYFFDTKLMMKITKLLKLINMSSGLSCGLSAYQSFAGFQWFFLLNALCWKHKNNKEKRRYEKSVLLIARKNGKSFLVSIIFIILMLLEPQFSEFYSIAPDRELSSIVKKELQNTIAVSPYLQKYFETIKTESRCRITNSKFIPLACSENRMDGRKANVWVCDECGALKNRYPIDAMQSSQMNMLNRTGIIISTAYPSLNNPMTQEVEYAKKVLDGENEDDTIFALLYMPDDTEDWLSDKSLFEANPLAIDLKDNYDYLVKQRNLAIEIPEAQTNFKTKHMNIFVDGDDSEVYIPLEKLRKCKIKDYDWHGKDVYIGVDLSQTTDNTAISMVTFDKSLNKFVIQSFAFIPFDGIDTKSKKEKVDYRQYIKNGWCYGCGDEVIDYAFVEDFVINLKERFGVNILDIGYDRYNCISSANRWYRAGLNVTEIRQHSSVLHPATKFLKEKVLQEEVLYVENDMLETNFSNARMVLDTNLNGYVNKKKSTGKIDIVASIINAFVFWEKETQGIANIYESEEERESGFIVL